MTLLLTISVDVLEAALYQTGPLFASQKNDASLAGGGPRVVIRDYHEVLSTIAKIEAAGNTITSILALIGPVSFTRHRQTITLMNAIGVTRSIPVAALTYTTDIPDSKEIAAAVMKLKTTKPGSLLTPAYRAEPTITLRPAPLQRVEAHREQGKPQK